LMLIEALQNYIFISESLETDNGERYYES